MMEHKGYVAAVEFDDSIEVLHGRVVNSGPYPITTFEATDARMLRTEFERSVDEYLEWCAEEGVEPRVVDAVRPAIGGSVTGHRSGDQR